MSQSDKIGDMKVHKHADRQSDSEKKNNNLQVGT